jgi:hypothetical protein
MDTPEKKQNLSSQVVKDDIEVRFLMVRRGTRIVGLAIHLPSGIREYSSPCLTYAEAEQEARTLLSESLPERLLRIERGEEVASSYFSRLKDR